MNTTVVVHEACHHTSIVLTGWSAIRTKANDKQIQLHLRPPSPASPQRLLLLPKSTGAPLTGHPNHDGFDTLGSWRLTTTNISSASLSPCQCVSLLQPLGAFWKAERARGAPQPRSRKGINRRKTLASLGRQARHTRFGLFPTTCIRRGATPC